MARVAIVYPAREFVPPQVRAFVDMVAAWAPGEFGKALSTRGGKAPPDGTAEPRVKAARPKRRSVAKKRA